jgi:hypothetical protein
MKAPGIMSKNVVAFSSFFNASGLGTKPSKSPIEFMQLTGWQKFTTMVRAVKALVPLPTRKNPNSDYRENIVVKFATRNGFGIMAGRQLMENREFELRRWVRFFYMGIHVYEGKFILQNRLSLTASRVGPQAQPEHPLNGTDCLQAAGYRKIGFVFSFAVVLVFALHFRWAAARLAEPKWHR